MLYHCGLRAASTKKHVSFAHDIHHQLQIPKFAATEATVALLPEVVVARIASQPCMLLSADRVQHADSSRVILHAAPPSHLEYNRLTCKPAGAWK